MSDRAEEIRVRVEANSRDVPALAGYGRFAAGRVVAGIGSASRRSESAMILVAGDHAIDSDITSPASACLFLDGALDPAMALGVPALATTIALWDRLHLELGDAAVWTGGTPMSGLFGQVALWRGACPAIELGPSTSGGHVAETQTQRVDWSDQEAASERLSQLAANRPGFAGIELTGRADVIDILFEVIPRWGRLVLAGAPGAPLTIDFYKNVHRKGIVISSTTIQPDAIFDPLAGAEVKRQVRRAVAILQNSRMAERCGQLLGIVRSAQTVFVAR